MRGARATIVMPEDAPQAKVDAVRGYGAEIVLVKPEDREKKTHEIVEAQGAKLVHPSNDPLVMSGQGTAFLELFAQADQRLDAVIVPVGGGGLLSGVAMAAKSLNPNILVIAGEPANADDAYRSLATGVLQGHKNNQVPTTIADGLRTTLGTNTFAVTSALVDRIILVSEHEITQAMKLVFERMKLVVEASSAVAVAAVLSDEFRLEILEKHPQVKRIGLILSGGNVSFSSKLPFQ